jgi:hypothetical protein
MPGLFCCRISPPCHLERTMPGKGEEGNLHFTPRIKLINTWPHSVISDSYVFTPKYFNPQACEATLGWPLQTD